MMTETFLGIPLLIYAWVGIATLLLGWLFHISKRPIVSYAAYLTVAVNVGIVACWVLKVGRLNSAIYRLHFMEAVEYRPSLRAISDDATSCYLMSFFAAAVIIYALTFAWMAWSNRHLHLENAH